MYVVKNHFRWQVEDKVLQLTTDSDLFSPAQQAGTDSGRQQLVSLRCTYLLLLLNFVVFLIEIIRGGSTNTTVLIELGAKYNPRLWMGEYWRLLTPLFLHAGWGHFLFNSLALLQLGTIVENLWAKPVLLIYFSAGLWGRSPACLCNQYDRGGASGSLTSPLVLSVYVYHRLLKRYLVVTSGNVGVNLILGFVSRDRLHISGLTGGCSVPTY